MSDEIILGQLATEMAQLRQQMELMSQRLDMIYGAVTRLAETKSSPTSASAQGGQAKGTQSPTAMPLTAAMMMDPGSMLDSLRQYAVNVGLDISQETVDRLKFPTEPTSSLKGGEAPRPPDDDQREARTGQTSRSTDDTKDE